MAEPKLPSGNLPFEFYLSLGPERRFVDVAKRFNVHPSAVTRRAQRERWSDRVAQSEHGAATMAEARIVETLAQMRLRHAEVARGLVERGLKALQKFEILDLKDAIRAVEIGVKMEREARELPSKTVSVEVSHQLRERLAPAQVAPLVTGPRPRIEVAFDDLESQLSADDVAAVERELEVESDG